MMSLNSMTLGMHYEVNGAVFLTHPVYQRTRID